MLAKRTIRALAPELRELADELGVSYSTIKYWKTGERSPSEENMAKLSSIAEERADELLALSARLDREDENS